MKKSASTRKRGRVRLFYTMKKQLQIMGEIIFFGRSSDPRCTQSKREKTPKTAQSKGNSSQRWGPFEPLGPNDP